MYGSVFDTPRAVSGPASGPYYANVRTVTGWTKMTPYEVRRYHGLYSIAAHNEFMNEHYPTTELPQ